MKNVKRVLALVLALVLCVGALSACGDKPNETKAPDQSQEQTKAPDHEVRSDLNIALTAAIVTNDPHGNSKDATQQLAHWVYDSLIVVKGDATVQEGLASWKISDDGLQYVFTLKDGVKFHNGEDITAEDVVWSIERCTSMAYYKNYTANFTDVKKTGDKEITITLKNPDNALLYNLYRVKIVNKSKVYEIEGLTADPKIEDFADKTDADGKTITAEAQWKEAYYVAKPAKFGQSPEDAGSGAFVIKSYDKDRLVELEAFADYWDKTVGNIKTVKVNIVTESSTRFTMLQTHELDFVNVPTSNWAEIKDSKDFNTKEQEVSKTMSIILNHFREGTPLHDKRVRQAIVYAIDRDALINVAASGMGVKAYAMGNPKYIIGSSDVNKGTYEYSVEKAKELLKEAGYPDGFTLEKPFLVPKTGDQVAVATQIQQMLKQVGINIEIDQQDSTTASNLSKDGTYQDLYITTSTMVYHFSDLSRGAHSRTLKTQVAKYALLPNDEGKILDDLYDNAQAATDPAERDRLYEELNKFYNDQCINVPLFYLVNGYAWDRNREADLSDPYYLYIQYWNWK